MCCIPPVKVLRIHICHLEYQGIESIAHRVGNTLKSIFKCIAYFNSITYSLSEACSEYVALGYRTDICLVMTTCVKHLRKPVYLKMEDNLLEIAVNGW